MSHWVVSLRGGEFSLLSMDLPLIYFVLAFDSDRSSGKAAAHHHSFGGSGDLHNLVKWLLFSSGLNFAGEHDAKKMSCLFHVYFLQTSFLHASNKTWYPDAKDGLSIPDALYSTGGILNTAYTDKRTNCLVNSLSWLSILFHALRYLMQVGL